MELQFTCPKCSYKITEKDFKENETILKDLKMLFDTHEHNYKQELKKDILKQYREEFNKEKDNALLQAKLNSDKELKDIEKKYDSIINDQKSQLENSEAILAKKLIEKESEITKLKQKDLDSKNKEILELSKSYEDLKSKLKNSETVLEKKLIEKESEITKLKQKDLDSKNKEISELKEKIGKLQSIVNNNKALLDAELLKKEQDVTREKQNKIDILNEQIKALEIANTRNKVIQNKTKGENFEQDVYGELEKAFGPEDQIEKITAKDKKADYLQLVKENNTIIGKIVYEVKNAEWSTTWEKKLIEDTAKQDAKYGILIATSFNEKYPNIPFKRSNENENIYLCDSESFIFVAKIIKTLIKVENKLNKSRNESKHDNTIKDFNRWKETQLPRLTKSMEDSFKRIATAEKSITKQVEEIRIGREKAYKEWSENLMAYINSITF